jgi:hypothetical protein
MKSNFLKYLALALILPMLITLGACFKSAPAAFEVTSLQLTPTEATAGETISIVTIVKNIGGSEGSYTVALNIAGATVESRLVTLAPGATETLTFSVVEDTPGTYQVSVGGLITTLRVTKKMITKEVELGYDSGTVKDAIPTASPYFGGHIVDFSPPATPFTLKRIRIAGGLYATGLEDKTFDLQILGKDLKVLYSVTDPYTEFPTGTTAWVEFEVPNIEVTDKFYVHLYTDCPSWPGLNIGIDDNVVNEHSNVTVRITGGAIAILAQWPYSKINWFGDKSKVNWMIRAVGTYTVPQD